MIGAAFAADLVATVNALNADLIVVTGDLVDGSVRALASEVMPLARLHAREGVVVALGNHEHLSGVEDWIPHFSSFGWHVLRNASLSLPHLEVIGLDDAGELEAIRTLVPRSRESCTTGRRSRHFSLLTNRWRFAKPAGRASTSHWPAIPTAARSFPWVFGSGSARVTSRVRTAVAALTFT